MAALKEIRGSQRVDSQEPEGRYQALEKYGNDLTKQARDGKLDPIIGRDSEIRRVMQVLSRRTKIIQSSSEKRASARRRSSRVLPSASHQAMSPSR